MRIIPNSLPMLRLIAMIATVTLAIVTTMVIGSYMVRRYELGNREGAGLITPDTVPLVRSALGVAGEVLAVLLCIVLYPFGYVTGEPSRARLRRGERAVILCHGYMSNRSEFFVLRYVLRRMGRTNVILPNFRPSSASIPRFAEQLSDAVKLAMSRTGCDQVDLVGHSMGGLVARYFIEKLGGAGCVHTAMTLGSPHCGTKTATLGLFKTAEQFRPGSPFIRELNESSSSRGSVNMIAVWSDFDNVVLPPENAQLPNPCANVMVTGVGHVAYLFSRQVFEHVRRALCDNSTALRYRHGETGHI